MNFTIHPFSITTSAALWAAGLLESIPAVLQEELLCGRVASFGPVIYHNSTHNFMGTCKLQSLLGEKTLVPCFNKVICCNIWGHRKMNQRETKAVEDIQDIVNDSKNKQKRKMPHAIKQSSKIYNFTLSISLLIAAALHGKEREKVVGMEAQCLCASGRGALESKRLPPYKCYLLMIYSLALHQSRPGGLSTFLLIAGGSLKRSNWERAPRSGSRDKSRFVPAGALNALPFHILWPLVPYIFKPSLKVHVRAQYDGLGFYLLNTLTLGRVCVFG